MAKARTRRKSQKMRPGTCKIVGRGKKRRKLCKSKSGKVRFKKL